jgi:acyl-CoA synthetase (AMP-forming)/AMP-acid ligase II
LTGLNAVVLPGFETGEQGIVSVVGIPDKSKGELLVLLILMTGDLSKDELRKRLLAAGRSNALDPKFRVIRG